MPFTKTEELKLDQNTDIKPYLEKIRKIDLSSLEITITGLLPGQVISSISLDVDGAGNICTQTNVSSA
ncbi:MAG: hypothetical protein MZV63_39390 [Marinilabiliales bacterium]|nr:hypothetical protein [Marinilabiliales bacterium]